MQRTRFGILALWLSFVLIAQADVTELLKKAKSKDVDERRNAFKDLGDEMAEAKIVLPTLLDGLKDQDRFVRRFAAQAVGKLEKLDSKTVLPTFNKILADKAEEKDVLEAVAGAMGKIGAPAVDPLAKLVKDTDRESIVRQRAAESLGVIGLPAKSAVPALLDALTKGGKKGPVDGNLRMETVNALGKIATSKDEEVVKMLENISMEKTKDKTFKNAVTGALKTIKNRK